MLLLIDNYDSFTYNLVHYLGELGADVRVVRNDAMDVQAAMALKPEAIVLSPGPCDPDQAGICLPLTLAAAETNTPLLGVCLGHQAIAEAFGGSLTNLKNVFHGIATPIQVVTTPDGSNPSIFESLPNEIIVGRYHSWVVNENDLPAELTITAKDDKGLIMGIQHKKFDVTGVQFHPESVLTPQGEQMIRNWLHF